MNEKRINLNCFATTAILTAVVNLITIGVKIILKKAKLYNFKLIKYSY